MHFSSLSDDARLWLFAADRPLQANEQTSLLSTARDFAKQWTSHSRPVPSEVELIDGRVLAVGASIDSDAPNAGVSGCGIDSLQHALNKVAGRLDFGWLPALDVLYRRPDGEIASVSRAQFRSDVEAGRVGPDTPVFDLTPTTLGRARSSGIERPAAESWHGRAFSLAPLTVRS